jgi:hypothetical protein
MPKPRVSARRTPVSAAVASSAAAAVAAAAATVDAPSTVTTDAAPRKPRVSAARGRRQQDPSALSALSAATVERFQLAFPAVDRIIALGDTHGDLAYTKECLWVAGVLAKDGRTWIGGKTVVVQTGDQLDRARDLNDADEEEDTSTLGKAKAAARARARKKRAAVQNGKRAREEQIAADAAGEGNDAEEDDDDDDDMENMQYLDDLGVQARRDGGDVFNMVGNHEMYNVDGHMEYVSYRSLRSFGYDIEARKRAFKPGGVHAVRMARTRRAMLIIGNVLFTHAAFETRSMRRWGIKGRESLEQINAATQDYLMGVRKPKFDAGDKVGTLADLGGDQIERMLSGRVLGALESDPGGFDTDDDDDKDDKDENGGGGDGGGGGGGDRRRERRGEKKEVMRGDLDISQKPKFDRRCRPLLQAVFDALDIRACVIGHTVQEHGITAACGRIARIDVGGSGGFTKFHRDPADQPPPQVLEILGNARMRRLVGKPAGSASASASSGDSSRSVRG